MNFADVEFSDEFQTSRTFSEPPFALGSFVDGVLQVPEVLSSPSKRASSLKTDIPSLARPLPVSWKALGHKSSDYLLCLKSFRKARECNAGTGFYQNFAPSAG